MSRTPAASLEDALEDWSVHEDGMWENGSGPEGWCAVSNSHDSIVAYFLNPADAYRFRLDMINRDLNP